MHVASLEGKDEFDSRAVRDVSGADAIGARAEQVRGVSSTTGLALVDTKNRSDTDVAVNVARSIQGIKGDAVLSRSTGRNDDRVLVLFRDENAADSRVNERVDHHFVGQDIELFLVVTSGVDFSRQTVELGHTRPLHGGCDELAGNGEGVEQDDQVVVVRVRHDEPAEGLRILLRNDKRT